MFFAIASAIVAVLAIITLRDWVKHPRFSQKSVNSLLRSVSQSILLQHWDKAEKELSILKENGKWNKDSALYEIEILQGTGRLAEAFKKVVEVGRRYPEDLFLKAEEGKILVQLGKAHEALEAFELASPFVRGESLLYFVALAHLEMGKGEKCLEILDPFLAATQNGKTVALAGDAWYELKEFQKAITAYQRAVELGCPSHHVVVQLGHAFRRLGNLCEAEKIFRMLLKKDNHDLAALLGLGACWQERAHFNKAFIIYQSALAWSEDLALLFKAAFMALKTRKYRIGELYFASLMQQQHPDMQTLSYYCLCLEGQKKWQEAEQTYLRMTQLFPSNYQGYRALAWMFGVGLSQTISNDQGMHFAHLAVKLKNDPLSWEILSACSARVGEFEKAYQIQLSLSKQDTLPDDKARRQQCLRKLRMRHPLDDHHIIRSQVA